MKRRTFVVTAAAAAAAAGAGGLWLAVRRNGGEADLARVTCDGGGTLAIRLEDVLEHPRAVRKVGRAVLNAQRVWPTREELAGRVFSGDRWERACRDGVTATLREAVRDDFRDDRTLVVRGWVLSRTEADLYALAEIVQSSR